MRLLALLVALFSWPVLAQTANLVGDLPREGNRPLERTEGLETELGSVRMDDGLRLRTFLTRPAGAPGALPAIFVTQWVSCGSMEFRGERDTHLRRLARQSGRVLIRIDRAGTGDSEGPGCAALDYRTEVSHYRQALSQMRAHPWVDGARIAVYGISLGATTAPQVAADMDVQGVVVQGGGALTHLERMIRFDRIGLERATPFQPNAVDREMRRRVRFQHLYLNEKMTPQAIAAAHPELSDVWNAIRGTDEAPHYGRPFAWHWQAADTDLLAAWADVEAPVLVLFGEYDQFEERHGHELIAYAVNRLRPGTARFVELPRTGHGLRRYANAEDALNFSDGEPGDAAALVEIIEFLSAL